MKIRIKRLIMGLALGLVFIGGGFVNANAQCLTCQPQMTVPIQPPVQSTCQGAYHYGPATPVPFGSVGGASGG